MTVLIRNQCGQGLDCSWHARPSGTLCKYKIFHHFLRPKEDCRWVARGASGYGTKFCHSGSFKEDLQNISCPRSSHYKSFSLQCISWNSSWTRKQHEESTDLHLENPSCMFHVNYSQPQESWQWQWWLYQTRGYKNPCMQCKPLPIWNFYCFYCSFTSYSDLLKSWGGRRESPKKSICITTKGWLHEIGHLREGVWQHAKTLLHIHFVAEVAISNK